MLLKKLANLSERGLDFFVIYDDFFVPNEEKMEFIEKEIFYHQNPDWESLPYIYPDGMLIDKSRCKTFFIESSVSVKIKTN